MMYDYVHLTNICLAHKQQFPLSFCSTKCLQAQLDNYHKKECNGGSNNLMRKKTAADVDQNGVFDD